MANNREVKGKRIYGKILLALISFVFVIILILGIDIYTYPRGEIIEKADVALVLGAAIWTDQPSPVFRERLSHAVNLYKENKVSKIIVTGGLGEGEKFSEAEIAEKFLIENGVLRNDIFKETQSLNTLENLKFSVPIINEHQISSVLVVSDPLHLRRSVKMANDLGISAAPSPTPTTRYQSFTNQFSFLMREIYFFFIYLIFGR